MPVPWPRGVCIADPLLVFEKMFKGYSCCTISSAPKATAVVLYHTRVHHAPLHRPRGDCVQFGDSWCPISHATSHTREVTNILSNATHNRSHIYIRNAYYRKIASPRARLSAAVPAIDKDAMLYELVRAHRGIVFELSVAREEVDSAASCKKCAGVRSWGAGKTTEVPTFGIYLCRYVSTLGARASSTPSAGRACMQWGEKFANKIARTSVASVVGWSFVKREAGRRLLSHVVAGLGLMRRHTQVGIIHRKTSCYMYLFVHKYNGGRVKVGAA